MRRANPSGGSMTYLSVYARDLFKSMRAAEQKYYEAIRFDKPMWVERTLCAVRLRIYDELIRHCPNDLHVNDDHETDVEIRDIVDGLAWHSVMVMPGEDLATIWRMLHVES
jgi:hypothetical protein